MLQQKFAAVKTFAQLSWQECGVYSISAGIMGETSGGSDSGTSWGSAEQERMSDRSVGYSDAAAVAPAQRVERLAEEMAFFVERLG